MALRIGRMTLNRTLRSSRAALAAAALLTAAAAAAHDTWFEPLPAARAGAGVAFALGTGNRFPQQETPIYAEHLATSGCRDARGRELPLRALQRRSHAIWLRADVAPDAQPSCWAEVAPVDIQLSGPIVELYLKEVNAPAAVRDAWAAQKARGLAWQERYTKHARIEVLRPGATPATRPVPMGMDVLLAADGPVAVGAPLTLQVLRGGKPLPDQAVELQSAQTAIGIWRRTDAEGRVQFTPPLPGRWLLRGTELRASTERPDSWDSGFITLAFDVAPGASSPQ